jgi:hypothetical protein
MEEEKTVLGDEGASGLSQDPKAKITAALKTAAKDGKRIFMGKVYNASFVE